MIFWNDLNHSDEENLQWCWLRAIEWGKWPSFISQPLVPILLLYFTWWKVIVTIVLFNWLWALFRYKYVNLTLLDLGSIIVHLKWPISIGVGIYFLFQGNYQLAALSGFWPLLSLVFQLLSPPTQIGIIQKSIMEKLGYIQN